MSFRDMWSFAKTRLNVTTSSATHALEKRMAGIYEEPLADCEEEERAAELEGEASQTFFGWLGSDDPDVFSDPIIEAPAEVVETKEDDAYEVYADVPVDEVTVDGWNLGIDVSLFDDLDVEPEVDMESRLLINLQSIINDSVPGKVTIGTISEALMLTVDEVVEYRYDGSLPEYRRICDWAIGTYQVKMGERKVGEETNTPDLI